MSVKQIDEGVPRYSMADAYELVRSQLALECAEYKESAEGTLDEEESYANKNK